MAISSRASVAELGTILQVLTADALYVHRAGQGGLGSSQASGFAAVLYAVFGVTGASVPAWQSWAPFCRCALPSSSCLPTPRLYIGLGSSTHAPQLCCKLILWPPAPVPAWQS